jgi:D-3-phosphoglycerate dehydrogenase
MTVLVNSPQLAAEGIAVLEAAGCDVHFMEAFPPPDRLAEAAARLGASGIIARQGRITAAVMEAVPALRIIARHGAGTDEIDLDAARARGLLVTRTPGANARAVAEHAIAMILFLVAICGSAMPPDCASGSSAWVRSDRRPPVSPPHSA